MVNKKSLYRKFACNDNETLKECFKFYEGSYDELTAKILELS